ncbi:hypothetical protein DERP_003880 [Dermatophagoides pteronyssinus]|uniref:Uncharacterized protein n=1 Tax=Dermatophagoides pteronyssinus TaxID=6956 RepID=A0ABQ8J851_DERPT|nr:hypothetical protein DERP_003880 [Dermatophagoides pteronyssinus]
MNEFAEKNIRQNSRGNFLGNQQQPRKKMINNKMINKPIYFLEKQQQQQQENESITELKHFISSSSFTYNGS